jgi:glycosyltransferase involved in cell wall biosynthesis
MTGLTGSGPQHTDSLVSVIIPTYNRLTYLSEAIDSVFSQSYSQWELIVIDDGSTDGTIEYVRRLNDPRVQAISLDHCGLPAKVRNAGLRHARGRYIAFLDSDDAWEPRKLELQLKDLRTSSAGWSYTMVTRVDEHGTVLSDASIKPWRDCSGRILADLLRIDAIVATPTVIVERALIEEVGGFDESLRFCQDYDLWFRIAPLSDARGLAMRLCRVRIHKDSRTVDRAEVHRSWVQPYAKVAATTVDPAIQTYCKRQCTRHRLTAAVLAAEAGRAMEAVRGFAQAALHDPLWPTVWWSPVRHGIPGYLRKRLRKER